MKEMEDFKRPDHNDFRTSEELRKLEWSGIRGNSITTDVECWIKGEIVFSVSKAEMMTNPLIFEQKYADFFGLEHASKQEPIKK